jgi:hypothetical protein
VMKLCVKYVFFLSLQELTIVILQAFCLMTGKCHQDFDITRLSFASPSECLSPRVVFPKGL